MQRYRSFEDVPFNVVRSRQPQIVNVNGRYAICGTAWGWLHNVNGGRQTFATKQAAMKRLGQA